MNQLNLSELSVTINTVTQTDLNNGVLVTDLIDKFYKLKVGLRASSMRVIKNRVEKWIRPYFEDIYAEQVSSGMILQWYDELQENLGASSVKQVLSYFRSIIDVGVTYFGLQDNIARKMKFRIKLENKPKEIWTRDEFNKFIVKVTDPHFHLFYNVLFNTGMRLGEIMGLQFKDINLKTGAVTINKNLQIIDGEYVYQSTKTTRSNRTIYLGHRILEEFEDYCDTIGYHRKEDRIFNRSAYKYRNYLKMMCELFDLKPITPHGFRHSFITEMISMGNPVNFVSRWAGHAKISTTLDLYTQETDQGNKAMLNAINDLLDN